MQLSILVGNLSFHPCINCFIAILKRRLSAACATSVYSVLPSNATSPDKNETRVYQKGRRRKFADPFRHSVPVEHEPLESTDSHEPSLSLTPHNTTKMGCGMSTEDKEGKARNEEIENQLKRDKMLQRNEIKMLLLGRIRPCSP